MGNHPNKIFEYWDDNMYRQGQGRQDRTYPGARRAFVLS